MFAKLKTYCVRDNSVKLLDSYFKDCFHTVKMGPVVCEWKMVSWGALRGQHLGHLCGTLSEILHMYDIDVNLNMYSVCR